ncbi:hypothetical protein [Bosea sp. (in: a-proteobacteria)]|uniref:hypothetical protein n=1 Tax=Bosea sp. (in: a-proteobacteria) TaxID=1871050 RepID=UPI0040348D2A
MTFAALNFAALVKAGLEGGSVAMPTDNPGSSSQHLPGLLHCSKHRQQRLVIAPLDLPLV